MKRYDDKAVGGDVLMVESADGEWVKWEDANARAAELEQALAAVVAQRCTALARAGAAETDRRRLACAVDCALAGKQRAESEAAALRSKVERAIECFALAYGSSPYHWPQPVRGSLEILRAEDK